SDDALEDAPPGQLYDTRAHHRVRRDRVAVQAAALDDSDPGAGSGQEQSRRGAGHPTADDHDVVGVHAAPSELRRDTLVRPAIRSTTWAASYRAPAMSPESRRCWKRWPTV